MAESESFWKIPKDYRYKVCDTDSMFPTQIGGRDTDVTQIAYTAIDMAKQHYPINAVPIVLSVKLQALLSIAQEFERLINESIEIICKDVLDNLPKQG